MKKSCAQFVPRRGLLIGRDYFACPYCSRRVPRGGHAEGFRKSGLSNHVGLCREILLYECGYLIGKYVQSLQDHEAIPVEKASEEWHFRNIRAIRAGLRRRIRDGQRPRLP